MRIYKCTFYDKDCGAVLSWHGNKREAERYLSALQKDRDEAGQGPEGVEPQNITMTRKGLLLWLNNNSFAATDNG